MIKQLLLVYGLGLLVTFTFHFHVSPPNKNKHSRVVGHFSFPLSLSTFTFHFSGLLVSPVAGGGCELGYVAHSDPKGQVSPLFRQDILARIFLSGSIFGLFLKAR